ncbi:choloylglycine hydrolase [Cetobacterium ceti]|uniref:Choloylglycine hydrolase n=1 Tax=Cetobacterium ceti TaxID=180163 RepID=A0A1T4P8D1_9FUSO|nr:choloylglycine hydrolase family protein [Cetobacterium ceti]SJZ87793.1 choloylglycine hydrolase [Cetobacterium ceti]
MKKRLVGYLCLLGGIFIQANACTGISLKTVDNNYVQGRTIEWGEYVLKSDLIIGQRGLNYESYTPDGGKGFKWKGKYGFVGISLMADNFIGEGINEKGLTAGIFYFTRYGSLAKYNKKDTKKSLMDMEFVRWVLSSFSTVDEVEAALKNIVIVPTGYDKDGNPFPTGHWRVTDKDGNNIVIEIVDNGKIEIFKNKVGVITNAPGYEWQTTNLNNYINLQPGGIASKKMGEQNIFPFGAGTGLLGLPGDVTPPSRFIRAAIYANNTPELKNSKDAVKETFHILNNFDIPIGIQFADKNHIPKDLLSATQWTTAIDQNNGKFYYKTMFNSQIRMVDLKTINFDKCGYKILPLDKSKEENIEKIKI